MNLLLAHRSDPRSLYVPVAVFEHSGRDGAMTLVEFVHQNLRRCLPVVSQACVQESGRSCRVISISLRSEWGVELMNRFQRIVEKISHWIITYSLTQAHPLHIFAPSNSIATVWLAQLREAGRERHAMQLAAFLR